MTSVAIECDQCGHYHRHRESGAAALACPRCGHEVSPVDAKWMLTEGCPVCGCRHLFRRKDFNQLVGLFLVAAGAALGIAVSYWFLLVFTLADLAMYRLVRDVAVCHRCEAEIRGQAGIDELPLFDHHTAEIYQTPVSDYPQS